MTEIKDLLDEVIETEIESLKNLESGSDEKRKAIDDLSTLHKLRIEEIKVKIDAEDKNQRRIMDEENHNDDEEYRRHQCKDAAIDRYLKLGIGVMELVLPLLFYGVWMKMGFEFEKEGTFTSMTFKNLFNRFKPTHKN